MGIFSKKDYVCEKCGKTFQKRINLNGNLCDDCWQKEADAIAKLNEKVGGYAIYGKDVFNKDYTSEELEKIVEYREGLMERFTKESGLSRAELQAASDNYKKLSETEIKNVLTRLSDSKLNMTTGAAYSGEFFIPTSYDGLIVDAKDVFAVGFTTNYALSAGKDEVIMCAVFTNDPYVPVFPMTFIGKTGFFELTKSKKGREQVKLLFEAMCPNLTYPVGDIKELKKQLKDGTVKGNPDVKFMLEKLSDANLSMGVFNAKYMTSELQSTSRKIVDKMGYIPEDVIDAILHVDRFDNLRFWSEQIEKFNME